MLPIRSISFLRLECVPHCSVGFDIFAVTFHLISIYHMNFNRRLQSELISMQCHINTIRYLTHTYNTHKHLIFRRLFLFTLFIFELLCRVFTITGKHAAFYWLISLIKRIRVILFSFFIVYCWIINIKTCSFLEINKKNILFSLFKTGYIQKRRKQKHQHHTIWLFQRGNSFEFTEISRKKYMPSTQSFVEHFRWVHIMML